MKTFDNFYIGSLLDQILPRKYSEKIESIELIWIIITANINAFKKTHYIIDGRWLANHLECIVKEDNKIISINPKFNNKTFDILLKVSVDDEFNEENRFGLYSPQKIRHNKELDSFVQNILLYFSNEYIYCLIKDFSDSINIRDVSQQKRMTVEDIYKLLPLVWKSLLEESYNKEIHLKRFCILLLRFVYKLHNILRPTDFEIYEDIFDEPIEVNEDKDRIIKSKMDDFHKKIDQLIEDLKAYLIRCFNIDNPNEYFLSYYIYDTDELPFYYS